MQLQTYRNYPDLSRHVADLIASTISKKPFAHICIASGHTPVGVFKCLLDDIKNGLDVSKVTFISLDEWLDIDPNDSGSCISMLRKDFFDHVKLHDEQIVMFDVSASPVFECARINGII